MRARFCYSELTFNFKLKSHACLSRDDKKESKAQAGEIFVFKSRMS